MSLTISIPGEPVAQGRPRFRRVHTNAGREFTQTYDPAKSRNWKATAQDHFASALAQAGRRAPLFPDGAVVLLVLAIFTCPRSHWRKTPLPRRPKQSKPDAENIAKAVQDAGNGVLFTDDSQVARLVVEKWIGAQGEAPRVVVTVKPLAVQQTQPAVQPPLFQAAP